MFAPKDRKQQHNAFMPASQNQSRLAHQLPMNNSLNALQVLQRNLGNSYLQSSQISDAPNAELKQDVDRIANPINSVPPSVYEILNTPGEPLGEKTHQWMKTLLGSDFSQVRIHTDEQSAASAAAVNANAYTVNQDIVFGSGKYAPDTPAGKRLIAHELVHTMQQRSQIPPYLAREPKDKPTAPPNSDTAKEQPHQKPDPAFGSPAFPVDLWNAAKPILFKLPDRWKNAFNQSIASQGNANFEKLDRKLAYESLVSFSNLLYAGGMQAQSRYQLDFSKSLKITEGLSGVSDTYLNIVSLGLHFNLKKFIETDMSDIITQNIGWAIIYGLLIQGGISGVSAALETDIDFTTLIKPALKKWTEAPQGFARPYVLGNIPDPRWSYPFWQSPSGAEAKLSGVAPETPHYSLNANLGINIASLADLYPEKEEDKKKYQGFELFPYFSLTRSWAKEGQSAPAMTTSRWLIGAFVGGEGVYTLMEAGQSRGAENNLLETYGRYGLSFRGLGPLSSLQLTGEHSARPVPGLRARLNAAATIKLVDNKTWQLTVGSALGGLLPRSDQPGAVDLGGQLSLFHQTRRPGSPDPFRTGFDLSTTWRPQDPFMAGSGQLLSVKGTLSLFDFLRAGIEYHQIKNAAPDPNLPQRDFRFMLYPGSGLLNF